MSRAASESCHDRAWQQHQGEILGFLEHRAGNLAEADDLLQEVFLKVLLQGKAFCELDDPRAWLFRVARNLIIDRRRLAKTREPLQPLPDDLSAQPVPEINPVDLLTHCLPSDDVVLTLIQDGDHRLSRPQDIARLMAAIAEF